jgi:hypothetical protein
VSLFKQALPSFVNKTEYSTTILRNVLVFIVNVCMCVCAHTHVFMHAHTLIKKKVSDVWSTSLPQEAQSQSFQKFQAFLGKLRTLLSKSHIDKTFKIISRNWGTLVGKSSDSGLQFKILCSILGSNPPCWLKKTDWGHSPPGRERKGVSQVGVICRVIWQCLKTILIVKTGEMFLAYNGRGQRYWYNTQGTINWPSNSRI